MAGLEDYGGLISNAGAAVPDYANLAVQQQMAHAQITGANLANQQTQMQMLMQQRALVRQQQFGQQMQGFVKNPTAEGLASLTGNFPELAEQAKAVWGPLNESQRRQEATQMGEIATLAANGNGDKAAQLMQDRIDADQKAGITRNSAQDQQILQMLKSGDPNQVKGVVALASIASGGAVGFDKAGEWLDSLGLSKKPVAVGLDQRLVTPQGDQVTGAQPKLENVTNPVTGESTGFNPYTGTYGGGGAPSAGGGGQASDVSGAAPSGAPRSVRNNNPGNLKATPFTKSLPGYQGVDNAGYAIFDNQESGLNAQTKLLSGKAYYGGGRQTVASIVSKWAPSKTVGGDNTPAQTSNYIKFVAQSLGVSPAQKLSPTQIPQLAQAMSQFEAGASGHAGPVRVPPPSGVPAAASAQAAPNADPYHFGDTGLNTKGAEPGHAWNADHSAQIPVPGTDADPASYAAEVDPAARNWIFKNEFPMGGGGMGGGGQLTLGEKNAIVQRGMQLWAAAGHSPEELKTVRSQYAGLNSSLQNATQTLSALSAAEDGLQRDANLVLNTHRILTDVAPNNPHGMGIVKDSGLAAGLVSNSFANNTKLDWYETHGSPAQQAAVKAYKDAVNAYSTSYSKFMTAANGVGGSAAPSDAARNQAGDLNDEGLGPTALRKHLQTVIAEAENKRQGWQHQVELLNNKMNSLGNLPSTTGQSSTPPVNIPQGAVQMLKANPHLAAAFDQKYGAGKASQILGH